MGAAQYNHSSLLLATQLLHWSKWSLELLCKCLEQGHMCDNCWGSVESCSFTFSAQIFETGQGIWTSGLLITYFRATQTQKHFTEVFSNSLKRQKLILVGPRGSWTKTFMLHLHHFTHYWLKRRLLLSYAVFCQYGSLLGFESSNKTPAKNSAGISNFLPLIWIQVIGRQSKRGCTDLTVPAHWLQLFNRGLLWHSQGISEKCPNQPPLNESGFYHGIFPSRVPWYKMVPGQGLKRPIWWRNQGI